tara:strand:- start:158 stop:1210 length:1053 start_codon:yes stop_codon:yes gene_type:complete
MEIYRKKNISVDFHRGSNENSTIIFTFTAFQFNNLDKIGFGVSFLVKNGYDVMSFKVDNDSWYQNVDDDLLEIASRLASQYRQVITYGSSMGGFAAILFSEILQADKVISISPQFSIRLESDKRWAKQASIINWRREIDKSSISNTAQYYFIYDHHHELDRLQVEYLRSVISASDCLEIKIPFSGHPSGHLLADMKKLSPLILDLLQTGGGQIENLVPRLGATLKFWRSLLNLARLARATGRTRLAHMAYARLVHVAPRNEKCLREYASFLEAEGLFEKALGKLQAMIDIDDTNAYLLNKAAELLRQLNRLDEAKRYCDRALVIEPGNQKFAAQKKAVEMMLNDGWALRQ